MEKVLYVLWRDPKIDQQSFAQKLKTEIADQLLDAGVHGLQVNVVDADVADASRIYYVNTRPQMEAVLNIWVDCALPRFRQPIDEIVARGSERFAAYLTTEAQVLRNTTNVPQPGGRTPGWAQIGLSARPERISYDVWLERWRRHTEIALETQPLYAYQQNAFTRALTPNAPHLDAMVEECFPVEAMADPYAFFDAVGDEEKYQHNVKRLMDSVHSFADLDRADVFPTSQYVIKSLT
jgi:hypothetical protein